MDGPSKDTITTENLMREIHDRIEAKIREGAYPPAPPRFAEVLPYSMIRTDPKSAKETFEILYRQAELPLEGVPIHSHRKLWGWLIVAFKKVFRFWTRKYTDALFSQQTNFNSQLVEVLWRQLEENEQLRNRLRLLEDKMQEQEKKRE